MPGGQYEELWSLREDSEKQVPRPKKEPGVQKSDSKARRAERLRLKREKERERRRKEW